MGTDKTVIVYNYAAPWFYLIDRFANFSLFAHNYQRYPIKPCFYNLPKKNRLYGESRVFIDSFSYLFPFSSVYCFLYYIFLFLVNFELHSVLSTYLRHYNKFWNQIKTSCGFFSILLYFFWKRMSLSLQIEFSIFVLPNFMKKSIKSQLRLYRVFRLNLEKWCL